MSIGRMTSLALALISVSEAAAGWQGTTWFESVEETDRNFLIPHRPSGEADNQWHLGAAKLSFDSYSVGDLEFHEGALLFKDDELYAIAMVLKDSAKCNKLISVLRRVYGDPFEENQSDRNPTDVAGMQHHVVTWIDEDRENEIEVSYRKYAHYLLEDTCWMYYTPYVVPKPGEL